VHLTHKKEKEKEKCLQCAFVHEIIMICCQTLGSFLASFLRTYAQ